MSRLVANNRAYLGKKVLSIEATDEFREKLLDVLETAQADSRKHRLDFGVQDDGKTLNLEIYTYLTLEYFRDMSKDALGYFQDASEQEREKQERQAARRNVNFLKKFLEVLA